MAAFRAPGSPANMIGGRGGMVFYDVGMQLSHEMIDQLTVEHSNEINNMYLYIKDLRKELHRVQELMQGYLAREEQLRKLFEDLHNTRSMAVAGMLDAHGKYSQMTADGSMRIPDPVADTQAELNKVKQLLAMPTVPPPSVPPHLDHIVR